jgi:hypothetical protein
MPPNQSNFAVTVKPYVRGGSTSMNTGVPPQERTVAGDVGWQTDSDLPDEEAVAPLMIALFAMLRTHPESLYLPSADS